MFNTSRRHGLSYERRLAYLATLLVTLAFAAGCGSQPTANNQGTAGAGGQAEGHDHSEEEHPLPETYAVAIDDLKEHDAEIRESFEAGNPEGAHDQLHHVGEVLNEMGALAEKAGMSEEEVGQVRQSAEDLFGEFVKLDDVIHRNATTTYDDVADAIQTHMGELESHIQEAAPSQ